MFISQRQESASQAWLAILATIILSLLVGCSSDSPTKPDDDDDDPGGITKRASFSSVEATWNTTQEVIWIEANLTIKGYADKDRLTVGGYWYRKVDGKYYYVKSDCDTNVPDNALGHQFLVDVPSNDVVIRNQQYAALNFSCFKTRTGQYYGRIKLYNSKSIGIDPKSSTITTTGWVSFCWGDCSGSAPGSGDIQIQVLSDEESKELETDINDNFDSTSK